MDWKESEAENDALKNYRASATFYIHQNQNHAPIAKLHSNIPLTPEDVQKGGDLSLHPVKQMCYFTWTGQRFL